MINQVKDENKLDKQYSDKLRSMSAKSENTPGWQYYHKNVIDSMNAHHGPQNLFVTNSVDTSSAFVKDFLTKSCKDYKSNNHWNHLHDNNIPLFIALNYQYDE